MVDSGRAPTDLRSLGAIRRGLGRVSFAARLGPSGEGPCSWWPWSRNTLDRGFPFRLNDCVSRSERRCRCRLGGSAGASQPNLAERDSRHSKYSGTLRSSVLYQDPSLWRLAASEGGSAVATRVRVPPLYPLNFGITSVANALSCSSITLCGVPMLMLTFTYSSPGYRDSISFRYAVSSSGGPANQAPFFM